MKFSLLWCSLLYAITQCVFFHAMQKLVHVDVTMYTFVNKGVQRCCDGNSWPLLSHQAPLHTVLVMVKSSHWALGWEVMQAFAGLCCVDIASNSPTQPELHCVCIHPKIDSKAWQHIFSLKQTAMWGLQPDKQSTFCCCSCDLVYVYTWAC